ncbi:hypothetical protein [Dickeya solani]|uniref:Uncharacterized protein n=1 Tax=Dickeya solani TaxID=1089444 RepID=A0AAX4F182_9GAMM|nr:hypothetical protein [Dickeya solani]WOA53454.1 hypothetical protein RXA29_04190 [Dickeya solani]
MYTPAEVTLRDVIDSLLSELTIINYLYLVASMNQYVRKQNIRTLNSQEFRFLTSRLKRIKIDVNQLSGLNDDDKAHLRKACHDIIQFIEDRRPERSSTAVTGIMAAR